MNYELPERYNNRGAGNATFAALQIVASVVLGITNYLNYTHLPVWAVALPALHVIIRSSVYTLLVNAFHEATRLAERDSAIDEMETALRQAQVRDTLNPETFAGALHS